MIDFRPVPLIALASVPGVANAAGLEGIAGLGDLLAIAGLVFCVAGGVGVGLLVRALGRSPAPGTAWRAAFVGATCGGLLFAVVYAIAIGWRAQEVKELNARAKAEVSRRERSLAELASMRPGAVAPALHRAIAILGDDSTPGTLVLRRRDGEHMRFEAGLLLQILPGIARALRAFEAPPAAEDLSVLEAFIAANDAEIMAVASSPGPRLQLASGYYDAVPGGHPDDKVREDLHGTLFWVAALGSADQAGARARCATLPEIAIKDCEASFDRAAAARRRP